MTKQVLVHSTPTAAEQCAVSTASVTMRVRANSAPSVADHSAVPANGVKVTHLGEERTSKVCDDDTQTEKSTVCDCQSYRAH